MEKFEPTQEEKDAPTYFDWDDARLGQFTKYCGRMLEKMKDDAEGLHRVTVSSCAMLLVGAAHDANASELTLNMEGNTHKGEPIGDWIITVKRKD